MARNLLPLQLLYNLLGVSLGYFTQPAKLESACAWDPGNHLHLTCDANHKIHIIEAYYVKDSSQYLCSPHEWDCPYPVDQDSDYFIELLKNCDEKQSCNMRVEQVNRNDGYCGHRKTDYVVVEYRCIGEMAHTTHKTISRCFDEKFNGRLCRKGTKIRIEDAYYGDIGAFTGCSNRLITDYDCRVRINKNSDYYKGIIQKCENKTSCKKLYSRYTEYTKCNTDPWNWKAEYVMLVYTCIPIQGKPMPVTATKSPPRPITEYVTEYITEYVTDEVTSTTDKMHYMRTRNSSAMMAQNESTDPDDSTELGIYVAVPLAIVVGIVVVLTVTIVCWRRKKNRKAENSKVNGRITNGQSGPSLTETGTGKTHDNDYDNVSDADYRVIPKSQDDTDYTDIAEHVPTYQPLTKLNQDASAARSAVSSEYDVAQDAYSYSLAKDPEDKASYVNVISKSEGPSDYSLAKDPDEYSLAKDPEERQNCNNLVNSHPQIHLGDDHINSQDFNDVSIIQDNENYESTPLKNSGSTSPGIQDDELVIEDNENYKSVLDSEPLPHGDDMVIEDNVNYMLTPVTDLGSA